MTIQNETSQPEAKTTRSRDIYQEVTNTIIQHLESGTAPWHKPWVGGDSNPFRLPVNAKTTNHYQGINILLLWCAAHKKEFASNEWATFKQWKSQNKSIAKGQKGTQIVYYDILEKEIDDEIKRLPFIKCSTVFNVCQLADYTPDAPAEELPLLVERLEQVEQFVANTKAVIKHAGYGACYKSDTDEIFMPDKNSFIDTEYSTATENYYSTLMHELVHFSGHPKRLNRKLGNRFGSNSYAEEELIAELGAAFLAASLKITNTPKRDHANYLATWLKVLKQDKHAIVNAASAASKAVGYLIGLKE